MPLPMTAELAQFVSDLIKKDVLPHLPIREPMARRNRLGPMTRKKAHPQIEIGGDVIVLKLRGAGGGKAA